MSLARRFITTSSLLFTLSLSSAAFAQTPAAGQDPAAARQFALDGIAAAQRNDWATVIDRFEQAEQRFHAPVHMRFLAIAYERTHRLMDSANMWRRLAGEQLAPTAPQPFRDAVLEAQRELPRVETLLGRVQIDWTGNPPGATFLLDGHAVTTTELSQPRWVEPGEHRVEGHANGMVDFTRTLTVAAGTTERIPVSFTPAVTETHIETPVEPQTRTVFRPNPLRTVGLVVGGVGVAALLGGVVTGLMANSAFSTLERDCPNRACATSAQLDGASRVSSLATVTNIFLVGGGVLAAGGAILFAVSPPRAEQVRVSFSPTGAQLAVQF